MFENYYNVKLKKLDVHEDKDNELYLSLIYKAENDLGVFEITIPKILLKIKTNFLPELKTTLFNTHLDNVAVVSSNMEYLLGKDKDDSIYIVKKVKDKIHEMTISEIENKLGYKIKIVNDETHVS